MNQRLAQPEFAARSLFAVGLIGSALALGSLHTPVLCVVAAAMLGAFLLTHLGEEHQAFVPKSGASLLVTLALLLVAVTALSTAPLPASLVARIAPTTADVWERSLRPFGEPGPRWISLSLDPTASRVEVLRGVTYLLAFATCLRFARTKAGSEFLERLLVAGPLVMAFLAILHPVLGLESVFGLYRPTERLFGTHLAPLLNTNHLASYVNMGLAVGLGVVLSTRAPRERLVTGGIVLFFVGFELFVASRSGVTTMLFMGVLAFFLTRALHKGRNPRSTSSFILAGIVVASIAMLVIAGSEQSRAELQEKSTDKLDGIQQSVRLFSSYFLTGTGRGAFESAFPAVRTSSTYETLTHPENVILQWSLEWGVVVAGLGFATLVVALSPRTLLERAQPPIGAWIALVGLALHNLLDFSSEVPGVMLAACAAAAIVVGGQGSAPPRLSGWAARPRLFAAVVAPIAVLAVGLAFSGRDGELRAERDTLRKQALDRAIPGARFDGALRAAMLRHPAEPYFPYLGAVRGLTLGDRKVVPWAARTLERSPIYGPAHLVLARAFARRAPAQARVEYRLALEQNSADGYAGEAVRLVHDFDEAMELVPAGRMGTYALDQLALGLVSRLPATRVLLDEEQLRRDPVAEGALRRLATDVVDDLQDDAPWCADRKACVARGEILAQRLRDISSKQCEGHALLAELIAQRGDGLAAVASLEAAAIHVEDQGACLARLVALMDATGNKARVEDTIDRVARAGCLTATECADNFLFAGRLCLEHGNPRRALGFLRKSVERAPERDAVLQEYAALASSLDMHAEILDAYTRLSELHPDVPAYAARAAEEREALLRRRYGGHLPPGPEREEP